MKIEAKTTVRNAELLAVQQGANLLSAVVFAAFVPRLMGPEIYGRYALINSLCVWFVLASGLGYTAIMGRFIPLFIQEEKDLKGFIGGLLTVRLFTGFVTAVLFLSVTLLWLRDVDSLILFSVAVLVFFQILAYFYYTLFLGFNRAARWGMGQVVRGWASLVLLFVGYHLAGLRGAFLGYLVAEIMVLAIGIIWARPFNIRPIMIPDWSGLAPYLRFGLIFFASDLLMATFQRGGQTLVRGVTGDYTQVGFFGAAYNIYITLATILPQLTLAFLPLLSSFLIRGRLGDIREWAERLHKWLAIGGMLVLFAVLMLGDNLVPLMLGSAFRPMVIHLLILTMALPLFALITVGRLLTMVWDRPGIALETAAVQLAVFFSLGIWFIARQGSLGGCLAVLGSTAVSGLYMTCRLRSVMRYSLRMWAWVIAFGGFFFPLVWLRSTWMMNTVLYGSFIAGYTGMLIFTRVLTRDEVNTLWRFVRAGRIRLEPTP